MKKDQSLTLAFTVENSPKEAFEAINNVRGWWSGAIEGDTDKAGAEFMYRYRDVRRSKQRITEFIPNRRVVWRVVESHLSFLKDTSEWNGTHIVFEISKSGDKTKVRFTHEGLTPHVECHEACSTAWALLIRDNLRRLIATGETQPDVFARAG